jgi:hypothetical protein
MTPPHGVGAWQRSALQAAHQPDVAEPRETHGPRQGPGGVGPYRHRPGGGGRETWDAVVHRTRGARHGERGPRSGLARAAVGREGAGLLQHTEPGLCPVAPQGHAVFPKLPPVTHADATRPCGLERRCQPRKAPSALGLQRVGALRHVRGCQAERRTGLMASGPLRRRWRHGAVGRGLLATRVLLGHRCGASIEPEGHRQTDGTPASRPGHRLGREGRRGLALVVMALARGAQAPPVLAPRGSKAQERVRLRTADGVRLWEQLRDTTGMAAGLEPRRCGEEAGEGGGVRTRQDTAGAGGQTLVVQDDPPCAGVLELVQLAPMRTEIAQDVRVGGHEGSRGHDRQLQETFALSRRRWERA